MILTYFIPALLITSIILNITLFIKSKKSPAKKTMTVDAQALMRDLLANGAMVHMRVLDAGDFFLKSPRD